MKHIIEFEKLFEHNLNDTYCMLKPSNLHGVGVFAIRNIPININPLGKENLEDWEQLEPDEYEKLPNEIKYVIKTYSVKQNGKYWIPKYGFHQKIGLANFLNHSNDPNIISINNGEEFKTIKEIKTGEELLIDYNSLGEEESEDFLKI